MNFKDYFWWFWRFLPKLKFWHWHSAPIHPLGTGNHWTYSTTKWNFVSFLSLFTWTIPVSRIMCCLFQVLNLSRVAHFIWFFPSGFLQTDNWRNWDSECFVYFWTNFNLDGKTKFISNFLLFKGSSGTYLLQSCFWMLSFFIP